MNLRIACEHLRFRISENEFTQLQSDGFLEEVTQISNTTCLGFSLRTKAGSSTDRQALLELNTTGDSQGIHLTLTILAAGVERLKSPENCKDGIQESITLDNGKKLLIGLEIDLHGKKGTSRP